MVYYLKRMELGVFPLLSIRKGFGTMAYKSLLKEELMIKIILLFVFHHYEKPVSNQRLTDLVLQEVDIDYFDLQKALYELLKIDWVRIFKDEQQQLYELTPVGQESSTYFTDEIPYIIKEKLLFSIRKQQRLDLPKTAIEADIAVSDKGEFNVYLKIFEVGDLLFELSINVGSRELALRTKEHFLNNALEIYMNTTQNVMKDVT